MIDFDSQSTPQSSPFIKEKSQKSKSGFEMDISGDGARMSGEYSRSVFRMTKERTLLATALSQVRSKSGAD